MTKGVVFLILATCLVASSSASPLLGGLTNILTPVTGLVEGVLGVVTGPKESGGLVGGLTSVVNGLLGSVINLVKEVADSLTATLSTVANTLDKTLATGLEKPLGAVTQLVESLTSSLNPSTISKSLFSALAPVLDALTKLVIKLVDIVVCLVKTVVPKLVVEILKGVTEIINCAKPLVQDVGRVVQSVVSLTGGTVGVAGNLLQNVTGCVSGLPNILDVGRLLKCVTDPVGQGLTDITVLVGKTTPVVADALKTALGVPQCAQNVLVNLLNKAIKILKLLLKCAFSQGVYVEEPKIPTVTVNFTFVATKSLSSIKDITLEAQKPLINLQEIIRKLQLSVSKLAPSSVNVSISNGIKGIQDAIDTINKTVAGSGGSGDPEVKACLTEAQKALDALPSQASQTISSCAAAIVPEATKVVAKATELDVKLKTTSLNATVDAFTKCSIYSTALDNSAQKCFEATELAVKLDVFEQTQQITETIQNVTTLVEKSDNCQSSGLSQLDKAGQQIVAQLKQCLAAQGVTNNTTNITNEIITGRASVERLLLALTDALQTSGTAVTNVKGSLDFVRSINSETLENVVAVSVNEGKGLVTNIVQALANESNPAVKQCGDTALNALQQVDAAAVQQSVDICVTTNKAKITDLLEKITTEDVALKDKFAKASAQSEELCKNSVSVSAAKNCFFNFRRDFNDAVNIVLDRINNIADQTQLLINDIVGCINRKTAETASKVDEVLEAYEICLKALGIDIDIPSVKN